jgi:hypothetical protein
MKNGIVIYMVLICLIWFTMGCHKQSSNSSNTIYSRFVAEKVQPGWHSEEFDESVSVSINGEKVKSENRLSVFSLWDNDSLYFFFKVADNDLHAYHPKLYLDDMVEVLIDTQNNKDSCWAGDDIVYHVNLLGIRKDDRGSAECITNPGWDGKARISVKLFGTLNETTDVDIGYLITLSFPWHEIGQTPKAGLTMGINFANSDNDGKGRQLFDWVGVWPMRSPYAFGNLVLKKKK